MTPPTSQSLPPPKADAVVYEMVDESNLTGIDVLIFIDQHVIVGAGDRTANDKWDHVGEIDGAGVSECLLVNLEIFDSSLPIGCLRMASTKAHCSILT